MESGRRWVDGLVAVLAIGLLSQACAGKSSSSDRDDGGRNSNGGTKTSPTGGNSSGGSSSSGTAGVAGCFVDDPVSCPEGLGCNGGACVNAIVVTDANNYRATSTLSIPTVETAPGDIDVCWPEVTTDLECNELVPTTEIDNVALMRFQGLSTEEISATMAGGLISPNDLVTYLELNTDHLSTCTKLSSLSFFGTPADVETAYEPSEDHYLFLFTRGTTPAIGSVTMLFATPVVGSQNRTINALGGCGMLAVTADFSGITPLRIPENGPFVLDLRGVRRDALGYPARADRLSLWFFAGRTLADLEAHVTDLDAFASETFTAELLWWTMDLSSVTDPATGERFQGFRRPEPGIWVLALSCSTCTAPLPQFLTVVEPSDG
ncbi:MAG TPA: hypothetical protein VF103_13150 [Polyangiaceae bacterium]